MATNEFIWQKKKNEAEYQHLKRFFTARPMMLCDCGIFIEDNDGFRYFYRNAENRIEERHAKWEDRNGLSTKAYMTANM